MKVLNHKPENLNGILDEQEFKIQKALGTLTPRFGEYHAVLENIEFKHRHLVFTFQITGPNQIGSYAIGYCKRYRVWRGELKDSFFQRSKCYNWLTCLGAKFNHCEYITAESLQTFVGRKYLVVVSKPSEVRHYNDTDMVEVEEILPLKEAA